MIEVASRDNILFVQSAGNQSWVTGSTQRDACDRTFGDAAIFQDLLETGDFSLWTEEP